MTRTSLIHEALSKKKVVSVVFFFKSVPRWHFWEFDHIDGKTFKYKSIAIQQKNLRWSRHRSLLNEGDEVLKVGILLKSLIFPLGIYNGEIEIPNFIALVQRAPMSESPQIFFVGKLWMYTWRFCGLYEPRITFTTCSNFWKKLQLIQGFFWRAPHIRFV